MKHKSLGIRFVTIAMLLCVCITICCAGLCVTTAEVTHGDDCVDFEHTHSISGYGIKKVDTSMMVKLTESGSNTIKLNYYFVTRCNIWPWDDTLDIKIDVDGNTVNCDYYLDIVFHTNNDTKVYYKHGQGNNNFFTLNGISRDNTYVTIKGKIILGVECIDVDLSLFFHES